MIDGYAVLDDVRMMSDCDGFQFNGAKVSVEGLISGFERLQGLCVCSMMIRLRISVVATVYGGCRTGVWCFGYRVGLLGFRVRGGGAQFWRYRFRWLLRVSG